MIAFSELLVGPAKEAGIKVPDDVEQYDRDAYPHWHLFCCIQLGARMPSPTAHWDNAKIIAQIPATEVPQVTWEQLVSLGISV